MPPHPQSNKLVLPQYRPDIDGLRAIAVIAVVCYHAFQTGMPGGFIGVDIFFVISGFLISKIVLQSLEHGTFSLSEFYVRRINRIFPALLLVLAAAFIFGWYGLFTDEYRQLGKHVAGGAGFVSNLLLWNESGYFDGRAETKPLLHLWSLGIEEQFYLIWPLLLWVAWRWRVSYLVVALVLAAASFAQDMLQIRVDSVGAFYSPMTRFWELLAGAVLAYFSLHELRVPEGNAAHWPPGAGVLAVRRMARVAGSNARAWLGAVLMIAGFCLINSERPFPSCWTLLPVLGTVLIISAGSQAWVNRRILSNRVLVFVGLISFPLYLWHWPLLSFAYIVAAGLPPLPVRVLAIVVATGLAWMTYRLVEKPIRLTAHARRNARLLLGVMAIIGLAGLLDFEMNGFESRPLNWNPTSPRSQYNQWRFGKNEECEEKYGTEQLTFCIFSTPRPEILLFGDSHVNQLYPGLAKVYGVSKGVLSIGNGPPLEGVGVLLTRPVNHAWQEGYLSYPRVMAIAGADPDIKTVVLGANWEPLVHGDFLNEEARSLMGGVKVFDRALQDDKREQAEIVEQALEKTVARLIDMKKNVVVAIDTPEPVVNIRKCAQRNRFSPGQEVCVFDKAAVLRRQAAFRLQIAELQRRFPAIKVFDPIPIICPGEVCPVNWHGNLIYRDGSHVSEFASDLLGDALRGVIEAMPPTPDS